MKNASHWAKFVLVLALAWMNVAAARAATIEEFRSHMPKEVDSVVERLSNVQDQIQARGWLSATASLFNQSATIYLYWPDKKDLNKAPLVVVPLTDLNAKAVFDPIFNVPSELDIGLRTPILFWVPERFTDLDRAAMPDVVPGKAEGMGLPKTVRMNPGLNLFGRVASGFLGDLLKPVNLDANKLTAGLATGKDAKGAAVYVIGLTMSSEWKNPFGLDQTSITGAAIRVIKEKVSQSKTIETWGTARVKAKDYTVYLQRAGLAQTLAFDTKEASLKQFFDIAEVVSGTLELPKIPFPSALPLDKVTLRNDRYVSRLDPASPPKFDNMMFMGSKGVSSDDPKLYINSAAYVFGWQAGKGYVNASSQGVDGDFAMALPKIGPIETSSASFYLTANASQARMGIIARTPVFGDLDLKAGQTGLSFAVSPVCPLRPVGFTADLPSLNLTDFPIKPMLDDCFSKELQFLAEGAEAAYKGTEAFVGEVAKEASDTAEELGKTALGAVESLHVERAAAWGKDIVAYADTRKATQNAAKLAGEAVSAAETTVGHLKTAIDGLDRAISSLTKDIKHLLDQIWGAISGTLKHKKKEREQKTSERDHARTEKAAAEARLAEARKNQAEKSAQAAHFPPSPYVAGKAAELQETLLGAQGQVLVQQRIAEIAAGLPAQLKDPKERSKVLGAKVPCPDAPSTANPACNLAQMIVAARKADFASNPPKISELLKDSGAQSEYQGREWVSDAKKSLIAEAVAARLTAETESMLEETVPTLPTMAYDTPVSIELVGEGSEPYCIDTRGKDQVLGRDGTNTLFKCNGGIKQEFRFSAKGVVYNPECNFFNVYTRPLVFISEKKDCAAVNDPTRQVYFFDPTDGLIRFLPPNATTPVCLQKGGQWREGFEVVGGPCPAANQDAAGARWQLRARAEATKAAAGAAIKSTAAGRLKMPGVAAHAVTNLAPLKLK